MRTWLLTFFLLFLVSCALQPADGGQPTATLTPMPTLTPTPTPTPLPHPAAFNGAFARGLIRYENGQWLVSVVQTADGGQQMAELVLLPDTFNTNDALRAKNPLAPLTVRARPPLPLGEGTGVRELTLIWTGEEFRIAYEIPNIQKLLESGMSVDEIENLLPVVSPEDFTDGTVVQSVLLAMQHDGYQPFSQEAAENYQKLLERNYGPRLHFEITEFDGTHVQGAPLKTASLALANFYGEGVGESLRRNGLYPQIMAPYLLRVKIGDKDCLVAPFPTLNPSDPKNVSRDDYIILFGVLIEQDRNSSNKIFWQKLLTLEDIIQNKKFIPFVAYLYAQRTDGQPLDPQSPDLVESLLAQLLGIEGNDVRQLTTPEDGVFYFPSNMTYIDDLGTEQYGTIIEVPMHTRLTWKIQTMGPFPFEVGVAQ